MRKLSVAVAVSALALAGAVVLPAGSQPVQAATLPTAVAPGAYSLTNVSTAKNLHVNGVSIAAGTKIVEDAPRGTAGQSWWVAQTAPGVYKLSSNNSGLCLQDAVAAGAALTQENCADIPGQRWRMAAGDDGYTLVNVGSGRAADVADAASLDVVSNVAGAAATQRWVLAKNGITRVTAWGTALTDGGPALTDKTIRMVVRPNLAGNAQRITLSNRFGTAPLVVGSATVGYQGTGLTAGSAPSSFKFGGATTVTIPAGGEVVSDALNVPVKTDTNLLVSVFVSGTIPLSPYHNLGIVSNGIADGNHTADTANTSFTQGASQFFFLKGIDVISATAKGSMVALGDSITDGWGSSTNGFNNWPAQLSDKINARDSSIAMVNAGISSNRVTYEAGGAKNRGMAATTRFAYDVAAVPGVTSVFLFEGINDIPDGANSDRLIEGYRNIIAQARAAGLKVYGATMTPTKGVASFTAARELVRTTTNNWIMTSGEFDAVVDFSAAVADPADPERILPVYDSGDKIHLSVAGYAALAKAVDVAPFTQAFAPQLSGPADAVAAGTSAMLLGTTFAGGETVTIAGSCLAVPATAIANAAGIFTANIGISASCPAGSTTVTATGAVSKVPVSVTFAVTVAPTVAPTVPPTVEPTVAPTLAPTVEPTVAPTGVPTVAPTAPVVGEPTVSLSGSSAVAGGELTMTGSNFKPGTTATFTLHSDPVVLGTAVVSANGVVSLTAKLPTSIPAGVHTLIITGTGANGESAETSAKLTVSAASGTASASGTSTASDTPAGNQDANNQAGKNLANTGAGTTPFLLGGLALLLAGALSIVSRRRNASHT
ncbi:GDSL-type esterase/lipase family protein [Arthrobacter sp. HLT1-20]